MYMKANRKICVFLSALMLYSADMCLAQADDGRDGRNDNLDRPQWGQRVHDNEQKPGGEPGRPDMGPGGPMMGRGMMGRGMMGPAMTTDELMKFLNQYDPTRARQLDDMLANQPQQFQEYIGMVCELYTPAARQMEFDPEAGVLAVKNISLQLDIKKQVADYKVSTDDALKERLKTDIRLNLDRQFELILEDQQRDIARWQERMARFQSRIQSEQNAGPDQMRPENDMRGRGRADRFVNMQERMKKELGKRIEDIAKWKEQKKQIVDRQLSDLIEDVRPFPWNL